VGDRILRPGQAPAVKLDLSKLVERIDRQHAEVLDVLRMLVDAQQKMTEGLDHFLAMLESGVNLLDTPERQEDTDTP
jgi:hypothetical protein